MKEQPSHCVTLKFTGLARVLDTPLSLALPALDHTDQQKFQTRCIWDTGASATVITQEVIDALGLKPTGVAYVNTVSERNRPTYTYQIDLFLSFDLVFENLSVTLGIITDGIGCLLGMDVIGGGDLSITNFQGNTCMSFRYPSAHEINFAETPDFGKADVV